MHKDSIGKTIGVALALCIVCAVLVSTAAVKLKPLQEKNKVLETKKNILEAAGLMKEGIDIEAAFNKIEARVVNLENGQFADEVDAASFNQKKAAKDPATSIRIPSREDIAKIKRRSKLASVYIVRSGGEIETIILPIHGKGLWSTMYAFVALEGDANTIKGLTFYEHAETPGLGGEVDNPRWKKQWQGKKLFTSDYQVAVNIPKGLVDQSKPGAIHQVDGLAGATLTTRGIEKLIQYWIGEGGFAAFLDNLRTGGING